MSDLLPTPAKSRPKTTRSRGGCVRCRHKRQKCEQSKPFCDRCVEAGSLCKYEVNLSWGGRSFRKSTFGKCLEGVQRIGNATNNGGFVYSTSSCSTAEQKWPPTSSAIRPLNSEDGKGRRVHLTTGTDGQTGNQPVTGPELPSMSNHETQPVPPQAHTSTTMVQPQPQRQISFLPPLAQYLFRFYTSETMRLTVPSNCAKTEICRFLIPMSFREPSLLYAIMAFAAVHLDAIGKVPGDSQRLIDSLHWASIRQLRRLLEDPDPVSQAVALATTRTLCQAQIYGGTSLWRVHLNGARAILESAHAQNTTIKDSDQPVHADFLSSWFNNAQALAALNPIGPFEAHDRLSSQPQPELFFDIYGGVMSDLPALFSEVGALVQKSRKKTSGASGGIDISDVDIELEADILTQEIHSRLARDSAENMTFSSNSLLSLSAGDIQDYALSNAGFLNTALLHIYYGVRLLSPYSMEVQYCVSQIINCAYAMSCESGLSPRVLLVAPLFTAGLCAIGPARDSIRSSLVDIGKWMKTPHLSKTLALLENTWERCPGDGTFGETWGGLEAVKLDFLPY